MSPLHVNRISLELFNTTLARYTTAAPSTLADLDTLRYETIPAKLTKGKKDAHLLKADVEKLVEWKLKHGTFRPTLMSLVKSNTPDSVKETTQLAFLQNDTMRSLKTLISLRGIGPATASLLLSVHQPDALPFFSDELFRWTHWDAPAGGGWERKIKYNVSEYKEVMKSVEELRERLGVRAVDAEKVAYVLGKEMANIDEGLQSEEGTKKIVEDKVHENKVREGGDGDAQDESKKRVQEALKEIREEFAREDRVKQGQKGEADESSKGTDVTKSRATKRKSRDEKKDPAEGTRKSTRRKA